MNEKWREIYTEEQIHKIQKIELNNLKVLDDVCKKIGIEYFVYGGTLIGAVRHKGFVPWDDDLDVAMSRSDYMKFVSEAPKLLSDEYYLQTPYNDKHTPYMYSKLRLKGTKCIEYGHHRLNIEKGIYIDIYPIDNIPDSEDDYIKQFNKYQRLIKMYVLRQSPYPYIEDRSFIRKFKDLLRFALSTILKCIPQKYFTYKIDAIMTKYNGEQTSRKGNLFYPKLGNVFYDLYPLKQCDFEGFTVNIPGDWDSHLTMRYGDYMELPAEDERIGHKPYLLDFGKY